MTRVKARVPLAPICREFVMQHAVQQTNHKKSKQCGIAYAPLHRSAVDLLFTACCRPSATIQRKVEVMESELSVRGVCVCDESDD